jgi:hypothetical protein
MVELPDGSSGGIIVAATDNKGRYSIILESGIKVNAPANKLLLRGCWTARNQYEKEKKVFYKTSN